MRNLICSQCQERFDVPLDGAQARCPRCGQSTASEAIRPEVDAMPSRVGNGALELPAHYASWDEFRSMSPALQSELIKLAVRPLPDMRGAEWKTLPVNVPPALDEFGRPLAALAIPGRRRWHTWAVGILVAAACLIYLVVGGKSAYAIPVFAGLAVWAVYFRPQARAINLWIFERGLFVERDNVFEVCPWEEVKDFKETQENGRPMCRITTGEGCQVFLSADQTPAVMPLAEYIKISIVSAQLLPKLRRIFDGDSVKFGVIVLDRAGLRTSQFFAPWSDIVRVMIDDANVFIDCRSRPAWLQLRYREISFALLLMAIAHIMIDEDNRLKAADA